MKTNEEKKVINFDLSQFAKNAQDFAQSNKVFKKENNITSNGREQQIYTKVALDAKRIELGKDVRENYNSEESKVLRKKLRNDMLSKMKQIVSLSESKSKNLNNWLQDFASFYATCYINHTFHFSDVLLNHAKDENKDLVTKGMKIFENWCNSQK